MEMIDIHLPDRIESGMAWWLELVTTWTGKTAGVFADGFEKTAQLLRIIETMNGIVP